MADRASLFSARCQDVRERAEEAFLVGSHCAASGVWFADVTIGDVRQDASIILALLDVAERAAQYLDTGRGDLDGALAAFMMGDAGRDRGPHTTLHDPCVDAA